MRKAVNPFTGEAVTFPIDNGLTVGERAAVRVVLLSNGASEPDPDGFRSVRLSDGTKVNVCTWHLDREGACPGLEIECYAATPSAAAFVFELASEGNMTIGSTTDPAVVAAVSHAQAERVKARWPSVPVLRSPEDLLAWFEQRLEAGDIV